MSKKYLATLSESSSGSKYNPSGFALKMLTKSGWKEGQGLGKQKQGTTEPVKIKRRVESLGLGADKVKGNWNDAWWEDLYNVTVKEIKSSEKETIKESEPRKKRKIKVNE